MASVTAHLGLLSSKRSVKFLVFCLFAQQHKIDTIKMTINTNPPPADAPMIRNWIIWNSSCVGGSLVVVSCLSVVCSVVVVSCLSVVCSVVVVSCVSSVGGSVVFLNTFPWPVERRYELFTIKQLNSTVKSSKLSWKWTDAPQGGIEPRSPGRQAGILPRTAYILCHHEISRAFSLHLFVCFFLPHLASCVVLKGILPLSYYVSYTFNIITYFGRIWNRNISRDLNFAILTSRITVFQGN